MPIYQVGQLNTTALSAPGVYLQIQPPPLIINGVPSNLLGVVGVGSWGPVNSPTLVGSPSNVFTFLGNPAVRKYDLATAMGIFFLIGATAIQYVRVTDGTDTAATAIVKDSATTPAAALNLTAFYTGTGGNTMTANMLPGTKNGTFKLVIAKPGIQPEVFDNLSGTGNALYVAAANAVNNGQSNVRGPSQLCVATAAASAAAPDVTSTFAFSAGTDGTATITDSMLVGVDGVAGVRKGMFCLRGTGAQVGVLLDHSDLSAASTVLAYGLSEGTYFGMQSAPGTSTATTATALNTAGADGYGLKVCVGDWVTYFDGFNQQNRLIGPTTFWAAEQASLSPERSSLNKPLPGIVSTQRVAQKQPYSGPEIGAIKQARLDVITNPSPGGNYYAMQTGVNVSSTNGQQGDNYTRMTNYLALTLASAFGKVIGENQTDDLRSDTRAAIQSFLTNLWRSKMIGDVNNPQALPFSVEIDAANNPDQQVANGYMTANVMVKYLSVIYYFVINLQGGQTVVIQSSQTPNA